jgi:hypothetical protein
MAGRYGYSPPGRILKDKDIEHQYILATNGLIKPTDFLRYLLFKLKICTKEGITIKTLQKSI